jgi:hypothetical protein
VTGLARGARDSYRTHIALRASPNDILALNSGKAGSHPPALDSRIKRRARLWAEYQREEPRRDRGSKRGDGAPTRAYWTRPALDFVNGRVTFLSDTKEVSRYELACIVMWSTTIIDWMPVPPAEPPCTARLPAMA